jgi:hypothetical protein
MTKIAKFFSYLFHPAFMPIFGIFIIFRAGIYETDVPWQFEKYTYMIVALFSILLPFSILPVFLYWKIINNFEMSDRKERIIPMLVTSCCLITLHVFISRIIPVRIITSFTFSVAALSIVLLMVNMFYKISMHLLAIGGVTGLILAVSVLYDVRPFFFLALIILIAGIAASSRLALKAHSLMQVATGYGLGLTFIYFIITAINQ